MYHSVLENRIMELKEKKIMVAALYEAKIKKEEIIRLLEKYCHVGEEEAINLFQNEKFINAPCRNLEQYLLTEKGYDHRMTDLFINKYAIRVLANNLESSKLTPDKLYLEAKKYEDK